MTMVLMKNKNQLNKQIFLSGVLQPKNINMVDELPPKDTSDYFFLVKRFKLFPFSNYLSTLRR